MQQGGSHYGAPPQPHGAEAVPPISSRPPASNPLNFDELANTVSGGFPDDEAGAERSPIPGNRWPRHETLALIKIRSEMDSTFKEATLKGPLWEEVSRKLAEQGITRSAKKCKEKFENVHKYYKRTKEGRAGRQDGKNYRFFSELEALHGTGPAMNIPTRSFQPAPINSIPPSVTNPNHVHAPEPAATVLPQIAGFEFSSGSESESDSETEEDKKDGAGRKRKRRGGGACGRKTMALFGEMMKKVMDQQEAMQQRFLDVIEKREQERMARDEVWKRQEAARVAREHELATQERMLAASRDAAIIQFLQKISDQTVPIPVPPPPPPPAVVETPAPAAPAPASIPEPQREIIPPQPSLPSPQPPRQEQQLVAFHAEMGAGDPASSRWPKTEVLALIDLRCALEVRYQDNGPKGPLWEEISSGMRQLGYNRSSKRCKEKWENINKYFKRVKESKKKRPEDAKTCPYFHQLDAIYRNKSLGSGQPPNSNSPVVRSDALPISTLPPHPAQDAKASNGGVAVENKAENAVTKESVKEMPNYRSSTTGGPQSDVQYSASISSHDDDDDEYDDDDDEEEEKMAYKIEFQRPSQNGTAPNPSAGSARPPATAGSFLAMVQ